MRIALGAADFRDLVAGKELTKSAVVPGSGFGSAAKQVQVQIILSDIGYPMMRQLIDRAERPTKESDDEVHDLPAGRRGPPA